MIFRMGRAAALAYPKLAAFILLASQGVRGDRDFDAIEHQKTVHQKTVERHLHAGPQMTISIVISGAASGGASGQQAPVISVSGNPLNETGYQQALPAALPAGGATVESNAALPAGEATAESNAANTATNKQTLYKVESKVVHNKFMTHLHRNMIQENRDLILKNYDVAFEGNRQLANIYTEEIFSNRKAILTKLPTQDDVQKNYKNSRLNEAKLDFLEHRSTLNGRLAAVSASLAEVNSQLIVAVKLILDMNEKTKMFNTNQIGINSQLLEERQRQPTPQNATPASNAMLIASNAQRIEQLSIKAATNSQKIDEAAKIAEQSRKSLTDDEGKLFDSTRQIVEDHEAMMQNSNNMSSVVSAPASSNESVNSSDLLVVRENADKIKVNSKAVFELEDSIKDNMFWAYKYRDMIEENRYMVLKNYEVAFKGICQLANINTDKIYLNRAAILGTISSADQVQQNYANAMLNSAKLAFLEQQAEVNGWVEDVSNLLADVNAQWIKANSAIIDTNQYISDFNKKQISLNGDMLRGALSPQEVNPQSNAERIQKNADRIADLGKQVEVNSVAIRAASEKAAANRDKIAAQGTDISQRRDNIEANHENMMQNSKRIAGLI
mmetsp:Transcript_97560/g.178297  ORF Transcript_97560/g.178297 Transcript_97560/m.178297 type:complete len:613 (+) Transcript_97560:75-1913(+)